nr:MAG: hypothetical protein 1 [Luteoviridae sp.]
MSKTIEDFPREVVETIAAYADLNLGVSEGVLDALTEAASAQEIRDAGERMGQNILVNVASTMEPEIMSLKTYQQRVGVHRDIAEWAHGHERLARQWSIWSEGSRYPWDAVVRFNNTLHSRICDESTVLVRPIGREWIAPSGTPDGVMLRDWRRVMTVVKALLYWRVITGQMIYASASFAEAPYQMVESFGSSRYAVWANARWDATRSVCALVRTMFLALLAKVTVVAEAYSWYLNQTDEDRVWVEIIVVLALFLLIRSIKTFGRLKLVETRSVVPEDRFLGQYMTKRGLYYKVLIAGKEHLLPASGDAEKPNHVDEMAMPGSEFFPCKSQPIGAILVATEGSDLTLFGTFWRLDDFFVTARHCSNTLSNSTAKAYAASLRQTKKGNYEVDDSRLVPLDENFFDSDQNLITSYDVDVFVRSCDQKFWAAGRITKASTRVPSAYNLQVHSVGFSDSGLLVSASGRTLEKSGHELLHHTASTKKGFSGSIILCGSSVIGMHVSASDKHNVAIRVEWIKYLIEASAGEEAKRKVYTYADASYKQHFRENKWRGGVAKISIMRDGNMSIILQDGQASYGWTMHELSEAFGYGDLEKDYDMFEDMAFEQRKGRQYITFDDENASLGQKAAVAKKTKSKTKPKAVKCYEIEEGLKAVHGPKAPNKQPEIGKVIDARINTITELGYQQGEFEYPEMTATQERLSLQKHLDLFGVRAKSQKLFPKDDKISRCARIVSEMLDANRFMPDHDYKTVEGLMYNVINTSIVGNDKSAGFPYCAQGKPKNGQVLEQFTPKGFAQEVLNKWDDTFDIKVFIKGEATKKKKIIAGMPRIVCGMPLHVTVKHASIFVNLCKALVDGWKESPVKYAFVPSKPGHLEHLKTVLPGKVYESDKSNWDFNVLEWMKKVTVQVVQNLAIKPQEWDEQQFCDYLIDVEKAFDQMFDQNRYRTSDGHLFKMKGSGIMKSGWFCTIAANSIMQVVIHVMAMIELGYEDDEIVNNWAVVAGGDDVNQNLDGVDVEKYKKVTASLGVVMEIEERENLESSEFFSSDIRVVKGKLTYYPKRFTKHIEHLRTIKLDDAAQALLSHMENYRHDADKFALFENLYHDLRKDYPAQFPVRMLKSRFALIDKQYGYESLSQW